MKAKIIVIFVLFIILLTGCSNQDAHPINNANNSNVISNSSTNDEQSIKNYDYEQSTKTRINNNVLGSKNNPILISDYDSLKSAFSKTTKDNYYKIICDIEYGFNYPLNSFDSFDGTLDGNNKSLIGFKIFGGGLFKKITGEIHDLNLSNFEVSSYTYGENLYCGILGNEIQSGEIYNCSIKDSTINAHANSYYESEGRVIESCSGGIAGFIAYNSEVVNCVVDGLVVLCSAYHHDKGWQKDPTSESPYTYFGGITGCIGEKCNISYNLVSDIRCDATNTVRISSLIKKNIYSFISLAGIAGYSTSSNYSLLENHIILKENEFHGFLVAKNEAFLNLIGDKYNYYRFYETVGNRHPGFMGRGTSSRS